ncbi:MAG: TIGR03118 family protein [Bryobacteraceae bacterium]|jgi:uncharacterized protein (TIGR03118 family)
MKCNRLPKSTGGACAACLRLGILLGVIAVTLAAQSGQNVFLVHNLISDLAGMADHQDPNLVNPWGNGFGASPFWIGNNGTGTSTLYDGAGDIIPLVVDIPAAGGATKGGPVTGVIYNTFGSNTAAFNVAAGEPAFFIFCSEDGLISGWNPAANPNALVLFDNSKSGAVYKGCALGGTSDAPLLLAANFNSGNVDVFDGTLTPVKTMTFADSAIPAGFAPFNLVVIGGNYYVSYAKQDAAKHDDVAGPGNGYVALFDPSGKLVFNMISQGALNSPWGMAVAPATFSPFPGALLVGNTGDGKINAFSLVTGELQGTLNDTTGQSIAMPGLWSLNFGGGAHSEDPGTLYFTAGISGGASYGPVYAHGLLGSIQPIPSFEASGILNAGSFLVGDVAPNTWVSIKGAALAPLPVNWTVTGTTLPTETGGVGVTVNGEAAPVSFVSNTQINFLMPADIDPGPVQIQTTNNGLTGAAVSATAQAVAPSFFTIGTNTTNGHIYIAATHANGSLIGPTGLISGVTTTGAAPGETIVLYGTGFGATNPATPNGQTIPVALPLPAPPTVVIGSVEAEVTFAGLVGPGLYQINVKVPPSLTAGDQIAIAFLGAGETQLNTFITVASQ